jgi:hypothetical protein
MQDADRQMRSQAHRLRPHELTTHLIGNTPGILARISEPDVNMCVWQRPSIDQIERELVSLTPRDLPDLRCPCTLNKFDAAVTGLMANQGLSPDLFKHWREDLLNIARAYFPLTGGRRVTMRLETTDQDGCPRFHTDRTHLRLLCTYLGPGTEWLRDDQADREAQLAGAPNSEILLTDKPSQLGRFWVGLLKGSAFPGNSLNGLIHRSPPSRGPGVNRVLFCLDS